MCPSLSLPASFLSPREPPFAMIQAASVSFPSVSLSLSFFPPVCLSLSLSLCLSLSLSLSVCLCPCLFVFLFVSLCLCLLLNYFASHQSQAGGAPCGPLQKRSCGGPWVGAPKSFSRDWGPLSPLQGPFKGRRSGVRFPAENELSWQTKGTSSRPPSRAPPQCDPEGLALGAPLEEPVLKGSLRKTLLGAPLLFREGWFVWV